MSQEAKLLEPAATSISGLLTRNPYFYADRRRPRDTKRPHTAKHGEAELPFVPSPHDNRD
jgi:hypothetical protein